MKLYVCVAAGLMVSGLQLGTAAAATCNSSTPGTSPAWVKFEDTVKTQYGLNRLTPRGKSLAYGHALRRLEADPTQANAAACIREKLKSDSDFAIMLGATSHDDYALVSEAAQGRHNQEVLNLTGVSKSGPLYESFSAGPTVGGGSDAPRLIIREGSRPAPQRDPWAGTNPSDLFGTETANQGPNYDDLPFTSNGALSPDQPSTPARNQPQKIDPKRRGDHPCGRARQAGYYGDAYWYMDLEKYKSDRPTTTYGWEYDGLVCSANSLLYYTYEGTSFKEFECDDYWKNCRRSKFPEWKYTKIVIEGYPGDTDDAFVQYYHKKGRLTRSRNEVYVGARRPSRVKKFWEFGK